MWGGIVAVLNYIPYLGPIASALLLALGGLMAFADPWYAFLPALCFIGVHLRRGQSDHAVLGRPAADDQPAC